MRALQLIYSFFLGLAVVGFVGIGLDTFYRRPEYPNEPYPPSEASQQVQEASQQARDAYQQAFETWSLVTAIILLVIATAILVVALLLGERFVVLANGLLLGGLFTMVYAVGRSWSYDDLLRFVVIAFALVVTVAAGWFRFARQARAVPADAAGGATGGTGATGASAASDPELARRVTELEQRIEALRRALGG